MPTAQIGAQESFSIINQTISHYPEMSGSSKTRIMVEDVDRIDDWWSLTLPPAAGQNHLGSFIPIKSGRAKKIVLIELQDRFTRRSKQANPFLCGPMDQLSKISRYAAGGEDLSHQKAAR